MAENLRHAIRRKSDPRDAQLRRLLQYAGPDLETRSILENNKGEWSMRPHRFWEHVSGQLGASVDPQVEIVRYFLHASGDGA